MHDSKPGSSPLRLPAQVLLGILACCALSASAQPTLTCTQSNQPAATLLLPYFEVDLVAAEGRNTLFSIGNTYLEPVLVRTVVWTNWGHPALSFDTSVPAGGMRMLDLRRLLAGDLPTSMPPPPNEDGHFDSCLFPVTQPSIDPDAIKGRLLGEADPQDGLCYAGTPGSPGLATGYVTVDVVQDCSGTEKVDPRSPGYFGDCASGLAGNDNVLWGNVYRIDSLGDSAQGEQLVAITADQRRFGAPNLCVDPPCGSRIGWSFYRDAAQGNRAPLPTEYRSHFMLGQRYQTDLVVWAEGTTGPANCHQPTGGPDIELDVADYSGQAITTIDLNGRGQTFRLSLTDELGATSFAGVLRLASSDSFRPVQTWVGPLLTAQSRFSVGLTAFATQDLCEGQ
ncbi:MAG: hypothetical protein MPN21_24735 [Thermoanaerobaculia bacterium]|nr:hypothetical protein [Thermoanaerobaculia bacterium]